MKELSILELLNDHPLAGALMLGMLLVIGQIVKAWKGQSYVSRIEQENNRLAKQTSETVNTCAARTHELMERMEKFMDANDLGRVHSQLAHSIQVLENVSNNTTHCKKSLDRVDGLCSDISSDIKRTDSRVVHASIVSQLSVLERLVEDIKRISLGNHYD
jgi:archaellum component FlaC